MKVGAENRNKVIAAAVLLVIALVLIARGSGAFSVDRALTAGESEPARA